MMETYLIKFYYIGKKKYFGSQRQINKHSIEECLIDALTKKKYIIDNRTSRFRTASRTDRYVSARGAAFSITTGKQPILIEINTALPPEIGVWAFSEIYYDLSPRYDAVYRHYKYIYPIPYDQLVEQYNFDLEITLKACKLLEGTHDYRNFSKININESINTIRELKQVTATVLNNYLQFDFKGRSFLRQQIRRTVKVLMDVGSSIMSFNTFLTYFDSTKALHCEPVNPIGLILWDIEYNNYINFKIDTKSKERMEKFFYNRLIDLSHRVHIFKTLFEYDSSSP